MTSMSHQIDNHSCGVRIFFVLLDIDIDSLNRSYMKSSLGVQF